MSVESFAHSCVQILGVWIIGAALEKERKEEIPVGTGTLTRSCTVLLSLSDCYNRCNPLLYPPDTFIVNTSFPCFWAAHDWLHQSHLGGSWSFNIEILTTLWNIQYTDPHPGGIPYTCGYNIIIICRCWSMQVFSFSEWSLGGKEKGSQSWRVSNKMFRL